MVQANSKGVTFRKTRKTPRVSDDHEYAGSSGNSYTRIPRGASGREPGLVINLGPLSQLPLQEQGAAPPAVFVVTGCARYLGAFRSRLIAREPFQARVALHRSARMRNRSVPLGEFHKGDTQILLGVNLMLFDEFE